MSGEHERAFWEQVGAAATCRLCPATRECCDAGSCDTMLRAAHRKAVKQDRATAKVAREGKGESK